MYSAKEVAKITGLTTATLRYYEKENLMPPIARSNQFYRQYSDSDIEWINMIQCLRLANVPIRSIKQYVALLLQGGKTIKERHCLVDEYMKNLKIQIDNLQKAFLLTQSKLSFYEKLMQNSDNESLSYVEEWQLFKGQGEKNE